MRKRGRTRHGTKVLSRIYGREASRLKGFRGTNPIFCCEDRSEVRLQKQILAVLALSKDEWYI